jgi:hypothetical protein
MFPRDRIETLALDLEGTLISNAISQFPRPGLREFLEFCRSTFPRIVVYTAVREKRFRKVAWQLISEGSAPRWFGNVAHVYWSEEYKDLEMIPEADPKTTVIVDDLEECIHPDQRDRWIPIAPYDRPYPDTDTELQRVRLALKTLAG